MSGTAGWVGVTRGLMAALAAVCSCVACDGTTTSYLVEDDRDIPVVLGTDDGTHPDAPAPGDAAPADSGSPADVTGDLPAPADVVAPGDPGTPETGPDTPTATREFGGGVLVGEIDASGFRQVITTIRFTDPAPLAPPGSEIIGECAVIDQDPNDTSPSGFGYDAGRVKILGTSPGLDMSPINQGGAGTGYDSGLSDSVETLLPPAGSPITISALGGGDVLAFQVVVQAPMPVTVSAPSMGLSSSHSTSQDLTVRWNVAAGDAYLVSVNPLSSFYEPAAGKALLCGGDGDPGTFVIPKEALQAIRGGGSLNVVIGVTRVRTKKTSGAQIVPVSASRSGGGLLSLD